MRISDWSSDVCSSDLPGIGRVPVIIVAAAPVGISHDRLPPDLVKRDVLRRMTGSGGNRQNAGGAFGKIGGEAQRLHPAHRAADHGEIGTPSVRALGYQYG